tara:strand:+ start:345 stop:515 length:171 start_codon:yes stop_codon:yes gene_type:complete
MKADTITINREEWKQLFTLKLHMEQYFSYKNDSREVIAEMAPLFLKDVEKLLTDKN